MCRPAAMVLVKGRKPYWSATKDSHIEIRREFGLPENGVGRVTSVQVEIVPPGGDFSLPLDKWEFAVDQDMLPDWWDRDEAERDVRLELESWAKVRLIRAGDVRAEIKDGEVVTALLAGGTLARMSGGTLEWMDGGTLTWMTGGTLSRMDGGTLSSMYGGTLTWMDGGTLEWMAGGTLEWMAGGTLKRMDGGTLEWMAGGTLEWMAGGTLGLMDGGTLEWMAGGTLKRMDGGTLKRMAGGTLKRMDGGTLKRMDGGTLARMSGGTLKRMAGGTLGLMDGGTLGLMDGGTAIVSTHTTIRYQNSAVIVVRLPNERPATFVGDKDERVADIRKKERRQL